MFAASELALSFKGTIRTIENCIFDLYFVFHSDHSIAYMLSPNFICHYCKAFLLHQKLLNVGIFSYGQFLMRVKFSLSNTKTGNSFGSQVGVADIYLLPQSKISNFNRANIIWQSYSAIFCQILNIFIVIEDFL